MKPASLKCYALPAAALLLAAWLISPKLASAACPSGPTVANSAGSFFAKQPAASYGPALTAEDGYCAQRHYLSLLQARLGPKVGYKVAFAGKAAQERFGVKEPARGVLLRDMLLKSGAEIDAKFGVKPLIEPDFVFTVKSTAINDARTPLEALAQVDELAAFIELPDNIIAEGETLNGANIIAFNTNARLGVLGTGLKMRATPELAQALAAVEVILTDETGKEYSRVKGDNLMGNPLNVLLWLIESMRRDGLRLEPGDVISLGAMGAIFPPESGKTYRVRYEGLPGGTPEVVVRVR